MREKTSPHSITWYSMGIGIHKTQTNNAQQDEIPISVGHHPRCHQTSAAVVGTGGRLEPSLSAPSGRWFDHRRTLSTLGVAASRDKIN